MPWWRAKIRRFMRPVANLRLFVAVHPPRELAEAWLRLVGGLGPPPLPPHRLTPVEQIHLTMQFIGDTPAKRLDATTESVERATAGVAAFPLTPERLIVLPERGPARLIAMETDAPPSLLELQRRLAVRLATNVRSDAPGRTFRPHLTLCRFRSPSRYILPSVEVEPASFEVERIVLMRSTLSPQGAMHHEVAACELST
jgi:RNA 2',3'-cyclic 3'-phosphodiesterase